MNPYGNQTQGGYGRPQGGYQPQGGYPGPGGAQGGYSGPGGPQGGYSGPGGPQGGHNPQGYGGGAAPPLETGHGPYPSVGPGGGVSPQVAQWFYAVDADRSGFITTAELKAALVNAQGQNFSNQACNLMIGMFDTDRSGHINLEEFDKLYTYINQWLSLFKTYDRDQSGHIDDQEFNQALTQMGFRFSPEFISAIVKKCDPETKQKVSVDQFMVTCVQIQRFTNEFRMRDKQQQGVITIGFEDFLSVALSVST